MAGKRKKKNRNQANSPAKNIDCMQAEYMDIPQLVSTFDQQGYVLDEELATVLFLMLRLEKPLLLEGNPGVGKTEVAHILASMLDTELIRLQCYEGLDVNAAVYEWNYQKQLLSIRMNEQQGGSTQDQEKYIFGEDFLLKRPLLRSISAKEKAPVLLIDEIDRADEEFEAFLLELLSAFQISIPEMGTLKAVHRPKVLLTSNRTRELSDALRRRCLYHWIPYPDEKKELEIVQKHFPQVESLLAQQVVQAVHALRQQKLEKVPGIAETLDWVSGLVALGEKELSVASVHRSLGCLLKAPGDIEWVKVEGMEALQGILEKA